MKFRNLGRTGIKVSEICLGSMTWGTQNSEAEGHEQMDYAFSQGVNFIDTAEMYPTNPLGAKTQGSTEAIIGTWMKARQNRSDVVLATKITGDGVKWVRDGAAITSRTLREAVEGSLQRLQTDYIDLYQLHWPNRGSYHFRKAWNFDPTSQNRDEIVANIHDTLDGAKALVDEGKIRAIGLSNESAWGTSQFLRIAEENNLPRVASIQNEYSLLYRNYDLDLGELSHNEDVGLLAFSPLAAGILSGKYLGDKTPARSRREFSENIGGRLTEHVHAPVQAYVDVAKKYDLDPCQMALAWCQTRHFMASVIIGAVTMEQLKADIASTKLTLSEAVMDDIQAVYRRFPNPM